MLFLAKTLQIEPVKLPLDLELLNNYYLDSVQELVNQFDCADASASDLQPITIFLEGTTDIWKY